MSQELKLSFLSNLSLEFPRSTVLNSPYQSAGTLKNSPFAYGLYDSTLAVLIVKSLPAMQETQIQVLAWEDPLEKGMTTHSSIPAWRIS